MCVSRVVQRSCWTHLGWLDLPSTSHHSSIGVCVTLSENGAAGLFWAVLKEQLASWLCVNSRASYSVCRARVLLYSTSWLNFSDPESRIQNQNCNFWQTCCSQIAIPHIIPPPGGVCGTCSETELLDTSGATWSSQTAILHTTFQVVFVSRVAKTELLDTSGQTRSS